MFEPKQPPVLTSFEHRDLSLFLCGNPWGRASKYSRLLHFFLKVLLSKLMDKNKSYTRLASTAPYAWALYGALMIIFYLLTSMLSLLIVVSVFFWLLFFVQLIINLIRLIKGKSKLNGKQIAINIGLIIVLLVFLSALGNYFPK